METVRVAGSGAVVPVVLDVLLVEDDAGDALMIGEALADADSAVQLHLVGMEGKLWRSCAEKTATTPRPVPASSCWI